MSSYGSNKSGYIHPRYQQPPYPTTPGPTSTGPASPFYPPPTNTPFYPSSPTSHRSMSQPSRPTGTSDRRRSSSSYSSNPAQLAPPNQSTTPMAIPIRQPNPNDYATGRTPPSSYPPQPMYAPNAPVYAQSAPVYARTTSHASHYSHHSAHAHDAHAWGDGEDKYENNYNHYHGPGEQYGVIDEETEREYEKRYAREKKLEREIESRPTLGGSLMSMMGKVGRAFGGDRR